MHETIDEQSADFRNQMLLKNQEIKDMEHLLYTTRENSLIDANDDLDTFYFWINRNW